MISGPPHAAAGRRWVRRSRGRPRGRSAQPWVVLVLLLMATACADDGRELAAAQPWQTTTTRPSPPTSAPVQQSGTTGLELSSPDFAPGAAAPVDATCAGANVRPALAWAGVPDGTVELSITLSDQTDPTTPVLVWLAAGIEPTRTSLAAGDLPPEAVESTNDYGLTGWGEPCLESLGGGQRSLQWRVHALDGPSELTTGYPGNEAWDRVEALAVDSASLLMTVTTPA